jgi:hypothetical protein
VVIHSHKLLPIDAAVVSGQRTGYALQRFAQMAGAPTDRLDALGGADPLDGAARSGTSTTVPART